MSNYQNYRFILKPYDGPNSRYKCPNCGKDHEFSPYIDRETGADVGPGVGRCNREDKCSYHYPPSLFFRDNPSQSSFYRSQNKIYVPSINAQKHCNVISPAILSGSWNCYDGNNFVIFLNRTFGAEMTESLLRRFMIGTSKHWTGATVFWQIDKSGNIRTGKVMLYDSTTGHRVKNDKLTIQWVHKLLKIDDFGLDQCLFGEHQLTSEPSDMPVAIVESEKTAVIASAHMPNYIWMATGGIGNLKAEKLQSLEGRNVLLWPDLGAYEKWAAKISDIQQQVNCNLLISNVLERNATEEERKSGLDIADYLVTAKEISQSNN